MLFSAPMVRALLVGTKTQTRRLLNPQPFADGYYEGDVDCTFVPAPASNLQACARFGVAAVGSGAVRTETFTPRIQRGDTLWVREAWHSVIGYDDRPPRDIPEGTPVFYCAGPHSETGWVWGGGRPSTRMPRWASRLTLTVTDVRVQRLQDISNDDAIAEGIERRICTVDEETDLWYRGHEHEPWTHYPPLAYRQLWNRINGAGSWDTNPWVVAYSFTVEHRNIDAAACP